MPSKIKIEIRAELRDPSTGKLIKRYPWKRANSLLKQFVQTLAIQFSQLSQTIKNTVGAQVSIGVATTQMACMAVLNEVGFGILIGTGTTAVTITDYKLQTQVSTNISHAASSLAVENPDASTWRIALSRVFTNNTGSTLKIREVAIYFFAGATYRLCADHTLYSVDVPNGVGVTLTYRITVSL